VDYQLAQQQLKHLLEGETCWYTNLSQFSALLNDSMTDINWVGFYLALPDKNLKLGPFQGSVACVNIPFGQGVCGTAAEKGVTQLVEDVHEFPGHIACDSRSQSEIVIPMFEQERLLAVLDIDSPSIARFDESDHEGLLELVNVLIEATVWPANF